MALTECDSARQAYQGFLLHHNGFRDAHVPPHRSQKIGG
jgi:hypothetical protein